MGHGDEFLVNALLTVLVHGQLLPRRLATTKTDESDTGADSRRNTCRFITAADLDSQSVTIISNTWGQSGADLSCRRLTQMREKLRGIYVLICLRLHSHRLAATNLH